MTDSTWGPADDYILAWATPDADERRAAIDRVYAADAHFFSSEDGDLHLQGRDDIAANIGHVNERDVQGRGLAIRKGPVSVNHRLVRVGWEMTVPDGTVVMTGGDVLLLDDDGRIVEDYILIGGPPA